MRVKVVLNKKDSRMNSYYKMIKRAFPEMLIEKNPELIYVLGGDGAMLHAHKKYGHLNIPFFGKGLGTLNFIMNNFDNDFEVLEKLIDDSIELNIIKTNKIKVKVKRNNKIVFKKEAINDMVLGNHIMDWHSYNMDSEDGIFDNFNFKGLGICIATALGSTAYNINNGGKVLPLESNIWSATAIAADHRINDIINPQKLKITINSKRHTPSLYVDGTANSFLLKEKDQVILNESKATFKLAFLDSDNFIQKRMNLIKNKRR